MLTKSELNAELNAINAARKDLANVTAKNAVARASEIGNVPTEGGIERSMLLLYFTLGVIARKDGKDAETDKVFAAYLASYYRQDVPKPRREPSPSRKDTVLQNFMKFYNCGKDMPYDTYPIIARVLAERSMPIQLRGALVNKIREKFPKVAPTAKQLAAFFEEASDDNADGQKDRWTFDWEMKALCASILKRVSPDYDNAAKLMACLGDKDKASAVRIFGEIEHLAVELRALFDSTKKQMADRKPIMDRVAKLPRRDSNVVPMRKRAA